MKKYLHNYHTIKLLLILLTSRNMSSILNFHIVVHECTTVNKISTFHRQKYTRTWTVANEYSKKYLKNKCVRSKSDC